MPLFGLHYDHWLTGRVTGNIIMIFDRSTLRLAFRYAYTCLNDNSGNVSVWLGNCRRNPTRTPGNLRVKFHIISPVYYCHC